MNVFAERLRKKRREKNITQVELANQLGISRGLIGDIERGAKEPTKNTAILLADFFNTDPLYWIDEKEELEKLKEENPYSLFFETIESLKKNNIIEKPSDVFNEKISEFLLKSIEFALELEEAQKDNK